MSDPFERDLKAAFKGLPESDDAAPRIERAVSRALAFRARRRRRRAIAVAVGLLLALGGSAIAFQITHEDGRTVFRGLPDAPAHRAATPGLAGLPWLWQPRGAKRITDSPDDASSLIFPPGIDYRQAARRLYAEVVVRGTLPEEARVAGPVSPGIVADTTNGEVRLSLAAPFGYDPQTGVVRIPTLTLPRTLSPTEARHIVEAIANGDLLESLPKGIRMDWPAPAACQLTRNGVASGEPCPALRDARSAGQTRDPAP